MADENKPSMEGAKFYYEPWVDRRNRLRVKTVCAQRIKINHEGQETEIFYAYGSTGHCLLDECKVSTGQKIAKQRVDKVLKYFADANYKIAVLYEQSGEKLKKHKLHMNLLPAEIFHGLEEHLLPFNEVPIDEKVNITTLYDKADFSDKSVEEAAGIQNYDDKKDEKSASEETPKQKVEAYVVPASESDKAVDSHD